jgi:FKBP-type peptidyl-prolyl cis-trans isomerase FkpA
MSQKTLHTGIAVTVVLLVVGYFFILGMPFDTASLGGASVASAPAATQEQVVVQDVAPGTGPAATVGDLVTAHYTGRLQYGTVFDSSVGKDPISFTLGAGQVIPGWEQGIMGMQVGGKRILIIPPALAYGAIDYGPIPGNSTLIFEVEVVGITPGPSLPNVPGTITP